MCVCVRERESVSVCEYKRERVKESVCEIFIFFYF